jgi:hypothetical protein
VLVPSAFEVWLGNWSHYTNLVVAFGAVEDRALTIDVVSVEAMTDRYRFVIIRLGVRTIHNCDGPLKRAAVQAPNLCTIDHTPRGHIAAWVACINGYSVSIDPIYRCLPEGCSP